LHTRLTLRFVQAVDRLGLVTLDSNKSKDKKESWLSVITRRRYVAEFARIRLRSLRILANAATTHAPTRASHLARCHSCFQTKLSKIVAAEAAYPVTIYRTCFRQTQPSAPQALCQWTEADKAVASLLDRAALPASGHLRWLLLPIRLCFFGGIAKYSDTRPMCQTRANLIVRMSSSATRGDFYKS